MLAEFIVTHRELIIAHTRKQVEGRECPRPSDLELPNGVPVFLEQLGDALRLAETTPVTDHAQIISTAGRHGVDLLRMGLSVAQVVHDYGAVCQAITELAITKKAPISPEEFQTLNLCLDDAIAGAVTEYARSRERSIEDASTERLGFLAHELRNLLNTGMMSFESIRSGRIAANGSTGAVLCRSLLGIRDLVDRSLAQVRLEAGIQQLERISVADLVDEIEIGAILQAEAHSIRLAVLSVDRTVTIEGDRPLLVGAVANFLQNAFKFTPKGGAVTFTARATPDRVLFDVEDECGGLPPGTVEGLFQPYEQRGTDRSGVGLGLSVCLKAAKANGGEIHVRDIPGKGCVFTLDLPRKPPPPLTIVGGGEKGEAHPAPPRETKGRGAGKA